MKYKCPCCGYYTFDEQPGESYDICEVCYWEDDPVQLEDPSFRGGANEVSLEEAIENFKNYGACCMEMIPHVRPARPDEKSGKDEL